MAKATDKFILIDQGTLTFNQPGNYGVDFSGDKVTFSRGGSTQLTDAQYDAIQHFDFGNLNKLDLTGISFTDAAHAANFKFEPDHNYDKLIGSMLDQYGVSGTIDHVSVNGGKADVFKLIWDYVDDNYSYYNTQINKIGVELGLEYADYLKHGGTALTNVIAKYTPDGADAGTSPDRVQSLHDNLLGNLDVNSIIDKFFDGNAANGSPITPPGYAAGGSNGGSNGTADEITGQRLLDAVFSEHLEDRPYYSGNEGTDHAPTIAWDVSHGFLV